MSQEEFGKLLKRIRKENNLTQKDLAEKYNVTYQAVSKWENGKNMPDISLIKQISKDFNITIEDMIDGNYNPTKENTKTGLHDLYELEIGHDAAQRSGAERAAAGHVPPHRNRRDPAIQI